MHKAPYSKHISAGPGGWKCPCCFPPPGSRERYLKFRLAKRKAKAEAFKQQEMPV